MADDQQHDQGTPALWAPWRMKYLEGTRAPEPGCFFCSAVADPEADRRTYTLIRGRRAFVILNKYPYTNGHLMVAPQGHLGKLEEMDDQTLLELMQLTRDCQVILSEVMRPDGFNIGINVGRAAGAGVPGHLHIHIVPRWAGDANFMTAVAGMRIIPESLEDTHAKLSAAADRLGLRVRG